VGIAPVGIVLAVFLESAMPHGSQMQWLLPDLLDATTSISCKNQTPITKTRLPEQNIHCRTFIAEHSLRR
jgi:hypothetical protein